MSHDCNLIAINEYEIDPAKTTKIVSLLDECFPDTFDGRSYFKQLPHFRYLVFQNEALIGHMGVDHRVIKAGGKAIRIFGIIDLCVKPDHRRTGIAGRLLRSVEALAEKSNVDFLVLMGDDDTLYKSNGFEHVSPAMTRWLAVEDVESVSVIEKDLSNCFLIKGMKSDNWPKGKIDMLGHLF
ncbi:GNAT family N-acetyltransferase [Phyllobacterium salinisoli]|uniref:GNAT family N-acetyltransferase n=1 Tax=Phyllobacterium salinisoli TaxID=1899321 RepID=A0A368JX71_9HYPH|nr:GNAT family N-acetyltransferase [Phyllobacterium salinisoli]RCS21484.1 GNAT family N-acetyltransferase [Phyllobacterium salinisoli]